MGPCSHRSSSEADTVGFSASAGADFIGGACKKKEKEIKIKFSSSTTLIFEVEQCGAVFPQCAYDTTVATTQCLSAKSAHWQKWFQTKEPLLPSPMIWPCPSLHSLQWWDVTVKEQLILWKTRSTLEINCSFNWSACLKAPAGISRSKPNQYKVVWVCICMFYCWCQSEGCNFTRQT